MRMMFPRVRERLTVDRLLRRFFATYRETDFRRAITMICEFYNLKRPSVEWFEYLDWGKGAGRTYEDGRIHLVHPENWKRGRKYNTMKQWIHTVHHEMAHYLFWTDAERKADLFASGMMYGLGHGGAARTMAPRPPARVQLRGTRRSVARKRNAS